MLITFTAFLYLALLTISVLLVLWAALVPSLKENIGGLPYVILAVSTLITVISLNTLMAEGYTKEVVVHSHEAVIGKDASIINNTLEIIHDNGYIETHRVDGLNLGSVDLTDVRIAIDTIRYDLGILYELANFGEAKTLRIIGKDV